MLNNKTMESILERKLAGRRVYLDANATTPPTKEVIDALCATAATNWGNPSSGHSEGAAARKSLDYARDVYANVMKVDKDSVIFTSCGTESNVIALRSIMCRAMREGRDVLITSNAEHPSIKRTAPAIIGARHVMLPIDSKGYVRVETLVGALEKYGKRVGLISIILANNEFGTIQPISELARAADEFARRARIPHIPFHADATQIFGKYVGIEPEKMGIDAMTASAHKFHGPRGVGILYARKDLLEPAATPMSGGGQERGCRSGTENVAAIFASATALLQAIGDRAAWQAGMEKTRRNRDAIARMLIREIPGLLINGDVERGLYNTLNVSLPRIKGHELVQFLDKKGISISSGSACSKGKPSEALMNLYGGADAPGAADIAHGAVRISLSKYNTADECEYAASMMIRGWKILSRQ